MNGRVLLVDKAAGEGSTEIVRILRSRLGTPRIGHTGTLDPGATGLLVVCVDDATKLVPWLTSEGKAYTAVGRLGVATESDDADGPILTEAPFAHVTREALETALAAWVGEHDQLPPRISAIKVAGRRMYDRVRAGESVDALLVPRRVRVDSAVILRFEPPDFELQVDVGKGFYVRSLVRDLGVTLGTVAHVLSLRRTRVGPFRVEDAIPVEAIEPSSGITAASALEQVMPVVDVDAAIGRRVVMGHKIPVALLPPPSSVDGAPFGVQQDGTMLAVVETHEGVVRVVRGLVTGPTA